MINYILLQVNLPKDLCAMLQLKKFSVYNLTAIHHILQLFFSIVEKTIRNFKTNKNSIKL